MNLYSLVAQIGSLLLIFSTLERFIPPQFLEILTRYFQKVVFIFNPNVEITFDEIPPEGYGRSKAYDAIESYIGTKFSSRASRLKGNVAGEGRGVALSMDDYEEIVDVYKGVKVCWVRHTSYPQNNVISFKGSVDEKRAYILSFSRKDRDVVLGSYLGHVMAEGKAISKRGRKQRLYTNVSGEEWGSDDKMMWQCVRFEHPSSFETLAMDPMKKKEIVDDLVEFSKAREYYKKIGKAWKRGYLLHGPPGTGKSTMIAAIANFLSYDVYDLELTAVKDNTSLRKLLMEISKRAIVVIEDIDCSLQISGRRRPNHRHEKAAGGSKNDNPIEKEMRVDVEKEETTSKVTLSGLLNFMDGLWSASGGERIFVFTTNHLDKIDDALIRTGRMDKHIQMSYCSFEAFRVLARNYLDLDSHHLFEEVRSLLSENDITTADVAECLMPKSAEMDSGECLNNLIHTLKNAAAKKQTQTAVEDEIKREKTGFRGLKKRLRRLL